MNPVIAGCRLNDPWPAEQRPSDDACRHNEPERDQLDAEQQKRDHHDGDDERRSDDEYGRSDVVKAAEVRDGQHFGGVSGTYFPDAHLAPVRDTATDPTATDVPLLA